MNFRFRLLNQSSSVRFSSRPPGELPGARHEDVDAPEALDRPRDRPLHVLDDAHVALQRHQLVAGLRRELVGLSGEELIASGGDRDPAPLLREQTCGGLADALARPGHERDRAPEPEIHHASPRRPNAGRAG
jgi:hypothetical protein